RDLAIRGMDRRWNTSLRSFVTTPASFREVMRQTRAIVAGSVALQYLSPHVQEQWTPRNMDVFCPLTTCATVLSHLKLVEGYAQESAETTAPFFAHVWDGAGIVGVIRLVSASGRRVTLYTCEHNSPLMPLTYSWSTLLVNFLTADSFCVTYPKLTLRGIGCFNPYLAPADAMDECVQRYLARGFTLLSFEGNEVDHRVVPDSGMYCPQTFRTFEDIACMRMTFAPGRQLPIEKRTFIMDLPLWKFGGIQCGGHC
ncbi:hypothetical protein BV25DRAFT_1782006, partial [Artomyces pyxidatus]